MSKNVGRIDQYVRIVAGLALVAFAFQNGLSIQGWHWIGLSGFVLLATGFFRSCPAYSVLGISTRERRVGRT
jgi:Ni,Fe-hydrogenase I cytochrome b subunit